MSSISKLTVAASLSAFALAAVNAQQPTGTPLIHNGYVINVPSPAPAPSTGYAPTSGSLPATGIAPAAAYGTPNYGPAIPVNPQHQGAMQQPAPASNGYPPSAPQWNNGTQYGAAQYSPPTGQSTAIYYGSSQYRRDPAPQQPTQRTAMSQRNADPRQARVDANDQRPRFSTDPQPGDSRQKQAQRQPQNLAAANQQANAMARAQAMQANAANMALQQQAARPTYNAQQWNQQASVDQQWQPQPQQEQRSRSKIGSIDRRDFNDDQSQLRDLAAGLQKFPQHDLHDASPNELNPYRPGIDLREQAPSRVDQGYLRNEARNMNFDMTEVDLSQGSLNRDIANVFDRGVPTSAQRQPMMPAGGARRPSNGPQAGPRGNMPGSQRVNVSNPAARPTMPSKTVTTAVLQ